MAIVKVHNRQRGITYVYNSVPYWDNKGLKQPISHRKLIRHSHRNPQQEEI